MSTQKPETVGQIINLLERHAPSGTAESWDNVGLLLGDPAWKTAGAVATVDLTREAIERAKAEGVRLIINHHPCIFPKGKGPSKIQAGTLVFDAICEGIAVAAYHTNFDQCALEVPQAITQAMGLEPKGRLVDKAEGSLLKLVVYVPSTHLDAVREAVSRAGAGHIGNYDQCTFSTPGEGTFRGSDQTQPFLGKPGELERAQEHRLETILPAGLKTQVLKALFEAHPYEEVAFDLYPVLQGPASQGLIRGLGYGFWGEWKEAKSFEEVAQCVKSVFGIDGFWVSSPQPAKIRRVGFVAGKGASFVGAASAVGCDLFITGEAGYHTALDGARRGVTVMELGHRESERFFAPTVAGWLKDVGLKAVALDVPTQKIWA